MSIITEYIDQEVNVFNRNFCGIFVGRVGTGKSWSALRYAEVIDPTFNIDRVVFKISDLLNLAKTLDPGKAIIFDEAGIDASNRESYMNKLNKAFSKLLQTWRHRRLILLVTVPDIKYIDAGVRKMFNILFESAKVIKTKGVVAIKAKYIQVNYQSGKAYHKNFRRSNRLVKLYVKKPTVKLRHRYEKRKTEFTTQLYKDLEVSITDKPKEKVDNQDFRRCKVCGNLGRYVVSENVYRCLKCPNSWANTPTKDANIQVNLSTSSKNEKNNKKNK